MVSRACFRREFEAWCDCDRCGEERVRAGEVERRTSYLAALEQERAGLVRRYELALDLGEEFETLPAAFSATGEEIKSETTGLERARILHERIGHVDAEIARVNGRPATRKPGIRQRLALGGRQ